MKKVLFLPVIAVLIFFSCKRDHSAATKPAGKKYKVSFNVSNFTNKLGGFSNSKLKINSTDTLTTLNGYLDILHYIVYDEIGHTLHFLVQDSTDANMGMFVDSLPAGNIQIVFVAGTKELNVPHFLTPSDGFGYPGAKWQDTFWGTIPLTVDNGNISREVVLKRVIGKLELTILDNIPANADSLIFTVNPEAATHWNSSGDPQGQPFDQVTYGVKIPDAAKGHANFTVDRLIGNTVIPFTTTIVCKDASNHVLGSAQADNVVVHANVKTILSGNLFGSGPATNTQSFTVKIDTAWLNAPPYSF